MTGLYGNDAFSVFSAKNGTPVFWKRFSFSERPYSKWKYWKLWLSKHANLSNGRLFLKSLLPFFGRTYARYAGYKMKPLKKSFSSVKTKTNLISAIKLAEKSKHSFLLSIWWITFFKFYISVEEQICYKLIWPKCSKWAHSIGFASLFQGKDLKHYRQSSKKIFFLY